MRRALIGAVLGLVIGAGLAAMLGLVIHLNRPVPTEEDNDSIWIDLDSGSRKINVNTWRYTWVRDRAVVAEPRQESWYTATLYLALLLGGGFGAIIGATAGATGAIVKALHVRASGTQGTFCSLPPADSPVE